MEGSIIKDRITAGFIGGIAGGIAMNIVDWTAILLGLHLERLSDWASVVIYGRLPANTPEIVFAQLGQLFFAGFLGVIFSSLLLKTTSGNYLVKGWIYGIFAWFFIYAVSIVLDLPTLTQHTFAAAVSHFISASAYGLFLTYTLNWLDKRKVDI